MLQAFSVFNKDIICKYKEQFKNNDSICFILSVFHFDISGNNFNELQPEKTKLISTIFNVFHFEILGKNYKLEQFLKNELILITSFISNRKITGIHFNIL